MATLRALLAGSGVLTHVVLSPEIDLLLDELEVVGAVDTLVDGARGGRVALVAGTSRSPIPGFDFALAVPTDVVEAAPFRLWFDAPSAPTAFRLWLVLSEQGQARLGFRLLQGAGGLALTGATIEPAAGGGAVLRAIPGSVPMLVSRSEGSGVALGPALCIAGSPSSPASLSITADTSEVDGVVAFGLEPAAVLFGSSQIGFSCPAIVIDDSTRAQAPGRGAPGLVPPKLHLPADEPSWQGLLARELDFYLPPDLPYVGGRPIRGYLAVPRGTGGAGLVVETRLQPSPGTGGASGPSSCEIRIECLDPTASGLSALTPTLIRAEIAVEADGRTADVPGRGPLRLSGGSPLTLSITLSRDPVSAPGEMRTAVALRAGGAEGLLAVESGDGAGPLDPAKLFDVAALCATALVADGRASAEPGGGILLSRLAAAGAALTALFGPKTRFVLHGAEVETKGRGVPIGGALTLALDYSVEAAITQLSAPGGIGVRMRPDQPMRIRVRNARAIFDPGRSGLEKLRLDFEHAELEVEDPGAWDIGALEQLFDVLGSRSGRGSTWVEVDLRFKLNLGPIRVSGMTLRATMASGGLPTVTIRGMAVALEVPGVLDGEGELQLVERGLFARLRANVLPLGIAADATFVYQGEQIVLVLGVDLPAPVPLANSGFGLFGILGLFGTSSVPSYREGLEDPVLRQLSWRPRTSADFRMAPGQTTLGFEAAIGTLPDLGVSFSAKAGILVTVPDLSIRASLNGRVLSPPVRVTDPSYPASDGVSFLGFLGVDEHALTFGVLGLARIGSLVEVRVPVSGWFPFQGADDWYSYIGADGFAGQGREIGPCTARILPDLLGIGADAYLMMRGRGIASWPHGRELPGAPMTLVDGFVVAFGFAVQASVGPRPIAWAELYLSLDLLVGARPPTLSGFGRARGSLHLGPCSIGVTAQMTFLAQGRATYLWAQVTGRVELLFFDLERTVTLTFGDSALKPSLPAPDRHPLDRIEGGGAPAGSTPTLTDDSYRTLARLVEDPTEIRAGDTVWPDAMISIPFAIAPVIGPDAALQFPGVAGPVAPPPSQIGTEMLHHRWTLERVTLVDVTDEPDKRIGGVPPAGRLAARWQASRGGQGDVHELLLFAVGDGLWVNRRSDGGRGLRPDPIRTSADLCHRAPVAMAGWAVGTLAHATDDGFRLPPDPVSVDPTVSRVDVIVHHFGRTWERGLVPLDRAITVPPLYAIEAPRRVGWPAPRRFDAERPSERELSGHFAPQRLDWAPGDAQRPPNDSIVEQVVHLELVEPITDGRLVVTGHPQSFDTTEAELGVGVRANGRAWARVGPLVRVNDTEVAATFDAPGAGDPAGAAPVARIEVSYPLGADLGLVGLRGATTSAVAAAAQQREALLQTKDRLAHAAVAGPPLDSTVHVPHHRAILAPGRLYRLDVDMSWSGTLYGQDASGTRVQLDATSGPMRTYARGAATDAPTLRQLFFATTPKRTVTDPIPAPSDPLPLGPHSPFLVLVDPPEAEPTIHLPDAIDLSMVERYLAGYEPAQSESFRFASDPLRAHFRQDHVAALAHAYGFELKLAVRRTDRPGPEHAAPRLLDPRVWSYGTERAFLDPIDRLRLDAATASTCLVPTPGATAAFDGELATRAAYEIRIEATPRPLAHSPHAVPWSTPFRGVTFQTSRWRTPMDMLAALGFTVGAVAAAPVLVGDLLVRSTAIGGDAVVPPDDTAFARALGDLGLEGWPVADEPRVSRLWVDDGADGWSFAGLMLESPEPILRGARLRLAKQPVLVEMGPPGLGGPETLDPFDLRRTDAGGYRLLFLASVPFALTTFVEVLPTGGGPFPHATPGIAYAPTLTLTLQGALEKTIVGRLELPTVPDFAAPR